MEQMEKLMKFPRIYFVLAGIMLLAAAGYSQTRAGHSEDSKANFVLDLINMVDWPEQKAADENFKIYVYEDPDLYQSLKQIIKSDTDNFKNLQVISATPDDDLADCNILFVGTRDLKDLASILKKVSRSPVLTVSDIAGYARYGVIIDFDAQKAGKNEKYWLEINKMAARKAGLKIGGDLLKKADRTYG
jgi:hypothetical protein